MCRVVEWLRGHIPAEEWRTGAVTHEAAHSAPELLEFGSLYGRIDHEYLKRGLERALTPERREWIVIQDAKVAQGNKPFLIECPHNYHGFHLLLVCDLAGQIKQDRKSFVSALAHRISPFYNDIAGLTVPRALGVGLRPYGKSVPRHHYQMRTQGIGRRSTPVCDRDVFARVWHELMRWVRPTEGFG